MWVRARLMYLSKSPRSDVLSLTKNGRVVERCCRRMRDGKGGKLSAVFSHHLPHLVIPVQDSCPKESIPDLASLCCREKRIGMRLQQLFLCIPTIKVVVAGHQQELDVLGIHCDVLHSFVSEPPVLKNEGDGATLSIPRTRMLMIVDWYSSNNSRNRSWTYPLLWVANARMMRSIFPGNFPLTLHKTRSPVIARIDVAGGLTYTGIDPIVPLTPFANCLASFPS